MTKFRKKPVIIDAEIFDGSSTSRQAIESWIKTGVYKKPEVTTCDISPMLIPTLEGVMIAGPGDYIIRGVNGEYYPCKPDIFEKTYEKVTE